MMTGKGELMTIRDDDIRCQDARQADILRRIYAGDLDASPARARFAADPEDAPTPRRWRVATNRKVVGNNVNVVAIGRRIRSHVTTTADPDDMAARLAYASRMARLDRRRRLAAWLAGEGAIPPHVEALIERKATYGGEA